MPLTYSPGRPVRSSAVNDIYIEHFLHGVFRLAILLVLVPFAALSASAQDASHAPTRSDRTHLLVIDSYSEEARWNREAVPALVKVATDLGTSVRVEHLNGESITSDSAFHAHANALMSSIHSRPDAVFFIGNLGFNLRRQIHNRWPGIPMLLMGEEDFAAPLSHYIGDPAQGDSDIHTSDSLKIPLSRLTDHYNLTYVALPYQYERTVDLMTRMLPKLEEILFISDQYYMNRIVDRLLRSYVAENHPDLRYKRLTATRENRDSLLNAIAGFDPRQGLLFSSGLYESIVPFRHPLLTSDDMNSMYDMDRVFFTYREPFIHGGEFVGGWVFSPDELTDILSDELTAILLGKPASEIPFASPRSSYPLIDYDSMRKAGISDRLAPSDAHYINKPVPIWQAYRSTIINISVVLAALLACLTVYSVLQRRRMRLLRHHEVLLRNMPLAYSGAEIQINPSTGLPSALRFVDQNEKFKRLIISSETAESPDGVVHSDNPFIREHVLTLCQQAVQTGKKLEFAQYFNFNSSFYEFIIAPSDLPNRVDIYGIDITSHHRDSEKLRDTVKMLQLTLGSSRLITWVLDVRRGRIHFDYNNYKSYTEFFATIVDRGMEIPIDEWIGYIHADDLRRFKDAYRRLTEGIDKTMHVEYRLVFHRGTPQEHFEWIELNAAVSRYDSRGIPTHIVGSSNVITVGKRLQHDQDTDNERKRTRSNFLTNISSELRAPVNAIMNFAAEMSDDPDGASRKDLYLKIASRGQKLLRLYNDIVMLTSLDEGISEFNFAMVDVNALMVNIEETIKSHLHPGVELHMHLGMDQCKSMMATHSAEMVMANLLLNSCKHTTQGSIDFGYELRGNELYFYVSDTSSGATPEKLARLFDRFNTFGNGHDSGLSMAICKSIVEKIGGTIKADPADSGTGVKIWFTVPYRPDGSTLSLEQKSPKLDEQKRRTILVAEPTESDYILLRYVLGDHFDLLHAYDGEEALALYSLHKPDMIIVAINLPKIDGFEVLRALRSRHQNIPVVAISAFPYKSENLAEQGFDAFISKNESTESILQKVRRTFTRRS